MDQVYLGFIPTDLKTDNSKRKVFVMQLQSEERNDNINQSDLTVLTADIVSAYVSNHVVPVADIGSLIADVHSALRNTSSSKFQATEVIEKPKPAVAIRKSVRNDEITCLECGNSFKSLKRHLMTHHSLMPDEYRVKWELPADYPMVSPEYSEARSLLARNMGLGQRPKSNGRRTAA